jgi:tetratricopeptide (TPR) repeat protein
MLNPAIKASTVVSTMDHKIDSIEKVLPSLPEDTVKMDLLFKLIDLLLGNDPDKALEYTRQLFELADSLHHPSGMADAYTAYGVIYQSKKDYRNALLNDLRGLRIYEAMNNRGDIAKTYTNIGVLYFTMQRYDQAKGYFNKALDLCKQIGLKNYLLSNLYINLGNIASIEKAMDDAILYYKKAFEAARAINNTR